MHHLPGPSVPLGRGVRGEAGAGGMLSPVKLQVQCRLLLHLAAMSRAPSRCMSLVLTRRERESERSRGSPGERHLPGPSVPPVRGVRGEAGAGWTNAAGEVRGAASRRVVLWEGMAAVRWSRGGVITTHGRRRGGDKVPKPWQASPPWALGAPRQGREGGGRCQGLSEHHLPGTLVFPVGNGRGKAGAGWTFFATGHGQ